MIVLAAGIWLWTVANDFAITTRLGRAGPDLWPKIILVLLIGAALWGIADALFKSRPDNDTSILIAQASRSAGHEEDARQDLAAATDGASERHPRFAVAGIAAMLGYVAIIPYVGFLSPRFSCCWRSCCSRLRRRVSRAAAISLIGALVFFFVFQRVVYVSLPLGDGPLQGADAVADGASWACARIGWTSRSISRTASSPSSSRINLHVPDHRPRARAAGRRAARPDAGDGRRARAPFTYGMGITPAVILLTAMYVSGTYGGAFTSILFRIPGEPIDVPLLWDGYAMARAGEPAQALGWTLFAALAGGLFAAVAMVLPLRAGRRLALNLSTPEYFAVILLGLTSVVSLGGSSLPKALISLSLGLLFASVGTDPPTASCGSTSASRC